MTTRAQNPPKAKNVEPATLPVDPRQGLERFTLLAVLICFFLSGAAGLIYQVAWGKALGLIFGHTAYAVATVLAVFMGGLAAGSALLGRWSERRSRPLALYGWLEIGTAVTGAVSLLGLMAVRTAYFAAYPYVAAHDSILLLLRFVGAALVLFLPTFLMGGTLPILVRAVTRNSAELGKRLARLYWVNTAGAVAGTMAAGFLLLPTVGLHRTLEVAVALNILAAVLALLLSRREAASEPAPAPVPEYAPASRRITAPEREMPWLLLVGFAVVGATAMAYEVGWTRLLATQLGSSTYAFTLMLATFLTGIVLGSALFEWWTRRRPARQSTFALTQTFTALASLVCLVLFPFLPQLLPTILRATHESFRGLVLAQFAISALAMLPVAILFGFNFPAVTLLIAGSSGREASASAGVGRAYAWNTLGAIIGAVAAGFWLLPALGSFHLLAATAGANLLLATLLYAMATPRRVLASAFNAALLVAVAFVGFSPYFYDPAMNAFSTMLYWKIDRPLSVRENAHSLDVVYLADGLNSTISVTRSNDLVSLRTNGKADASNHDTKTQLMLGHLGALAHSGSGLHRVLVIGFGGGMTLSALSRYPEVQRLDCVEIEPAVLGAAPLLTELNRNVLQDPRVHIIFDDARNFLFTSRQQYDLIVSEPSNPWMAGIASLYTQEFYNAAQQRLAPGGIFVQWVQGYALFPDDLRMIAATFLSQFPRASLWHGEVNDFLLMAPSAPAGQMLDRVKALWNQPQLHDDFDQLGWKEPAGLFAYYLLGDAELREFSRGSPVNTDDLTLLEYHAPPALLVEGLQDRNHAEILRAQKDIFPADLPAELRDSTLDAAATTSMAIEDADGAGRFAKALESRPVTARNEVIFGRMALANDNPDAARRDFDQALTLDRNSTDALWGSAEVNRRIGKPETNQLAWQQYQSILMREPNNLPALQSLIALDVDNSRWPEAADVERRLIATKAHPDANDYEQLAELLLRLRQEDAARSMLQQCLALDPYNFKAHLFLGVLFRHEQLWTEAQEHLEFIRRYSPDADPGTYSLLYEVYTALGQPQAASEAVRFGLRLFPANAALEKLSAQR
jgi:spermidine synthase